MANWINNGDSGSTVRAKLNTLPNNGSSFIGSPLGSSGRLTLSSGVPVLTSTVSGATTVYFTPYKGNVVPVTTDGGSTYPLTTFAQLSQTTTDTTKSPAAVAASSVYDMFVWYDSGTVTLRCTRGPAWSSSISRGTGAGTSELNLVNGYYVNKNAITNGPGANLGTYVGSIASNGSSTIDFNLGGSASGGTAGVLNVWNYFNRLLIQAQTKDNGASYTYSSNTTRQARASAGNQITLLSGLAEDAISAVIHSDIVTPAVTSAYAISGISLDSSSALGPSFCGLKSASTAAQGAYLDSSTVFAAQLGQHIIYKVEQADGSDSATWGAASAEMLLIAFMM